MELGVDSPLVTPMPPEFQLIHPRRVRSSGWATQPDGQSVHFCGYERLKPEDESWYRRCDPENGLHPDDRQAFRASIRAPVLRGPVARFFSRLKFWSSEVELESEAQRLRRKQAD